MKVDLFYDNDEDLLDSIADDSSDYIPIQASIEDIQEGSSPREDLSTRAKDWIIPCVELVKEYYRRFVYDQDSSRDNTSFESDEMCSMILDLDVEVLRNFDL